jgi:hypothetical protein
MSSFISSLINRHTLKSDVVKPRLMTMFESESRNTGMPDVNEGTTDVFDVNPTQGKPNSKNAVIIDLKGDDIPDAPFKTISKPATQLKDIDKEPEAVEPAKPSPFVKFKPAEEHRPSKPVNDFDKQPEITDLYFPVENNGKPNTDASHMITNEPVNQPNAFSMPKEENVPAESQPSSQKKAIDEPVLKKPILKADTYSQSAYFTKNLPLKETLQPEAKKPSIKVTIGQIDVKAIPDTQPIRVKNRTTEAPRMSLDDYLKMRNSN